MNKKVLAQLLLLKIISSTDLGQEIKVQDLALQSLYLNYYEYLAARQDCLDNKLIFIGMDQKEKEKLSSGKQIEHVYITSKGQSTLESLEHQIPAEFIKYLDHKIAESKPKDIPITRITALDLDEYQVYLASEEGDHPLFSCSLKVKSKDRAKKIAQNWDNKCSQVYQLIIKELSKEEEPSSSSS